MERIQKKEVMDQHKAVPKNLLGGAEKKDKKHQ
jgi:hypothetical protein